MDEVNQLKRQKKYRFRAICERVLECIRTKIRVASACSQRDVIYAFRKVNNHGCPMISTNGYIKIKKYISEKLSNEGFVVNDGSIVGYDEHDWGAMNTEWTLIIRW